MRRDHEFRRVTFTVSTDIVDITNWKKLREIVQEAAAFVRARGCTFVTYKINDESGVGSVSFKPNETNVDILKSQIEKLFPECTFFVKDSSAEGDEN